MAVGEFLTWAVQAQSAPAHVARLLQTILLNEGVVDKAGNSFKVAQNTGTDMNVKVGSGTLGDLAVVEGDDTAGQGVYCHEAQNATVTRGIAASDPSQGRIDLVVLQNYDDEADSSGLNDADVEVVEGTPAGTPSAPALPASAIPLAEVTVGAGVTAITDADITDVRDEAGVPSRALMTDPAMVRATDVVTTLSAMLTSEQTKATATLSIPVDWSTYDVDIFSSCRVLEGASATGEVNVTFRLKVGGTLVQDQVEDVDAAATDNIEVVGFNTSAAGETTTGSVDVTLTTQLSAESGAFDIHEIALIAYAWRIS